MNGSALNAIELFAVAEIPLDLITMLAAAKMVEAMNEISSVELGSAGQNHRRVFP